MGLKYPRFDKSMPFGECEPKENGIAYWQAPHHYDINFNVVSYPDGTILEKHEGVEDEPEEGDGDGSGSGGDKPTVDLKAWATGEKNYKFFEVRKAMEAAGLTPVPTTNSAARKMVLKALK